MIAAHRTHKATKYFNERMKYFKTAVFVGFVSLQRLWPVVVAAVGIVANSKGIERGAKAVTIGSETYTAADVDYYYYTAYNSFVRQNSSSLSFLGLDTSKSLNEQDCQLMEDSTWHDYITEQAIKSLTSYSMLAQKAEESGFDGSEAMDEAVKQTYSDHDTYASAAGITRSQYIKSVCGPLGN